MKSRVWHYVTVNPTFIQDKMHKACANWRRLYSEDWACELVFCLQKVRISQIETMLWNWHLLTNQKWVFSVAMIYFIALKLHLSSLVEIMFSGPSCRPVKTFPDFFSFQRRTSSVSLQSWIMSLLPEHLSSFLQGQMWTWNLFKIN